MKARDVAKRCLRAWWLPPLVYALALFIIYYSMWSHRGLRHGLGFDTIDAYGPDLTAAARDASRWAWPMWSPWDHGGFSLIGHPEYQRAYPINWGFSGWGALFGTGFWLIQIKMLAHQWIGALGMHAFCRHRGLARRAAYIGGFGLIACGPALVHKASMIVLPLAWIPWGWFAIDWLTNKPTWQRGVCAGAIGSLLITAGSPVSWFYGGIAIGAYALFRLVEMWRTDRKRDWRRVAVAAGAALGVLVAIAAPVVHASSELIAHGVRNSQQGIDFAMSGSLPGLLAALGVIAPTVGTPETYMGVVIVLLALVGLAGAAKHRSATFFFVGLAGLGIVLAAGANTPLLPWLARHMPGFALLRIAGRYKLITGFAAPIAAAFGMQALINAADTTTPRQRWAMLGLLGAGVSATLLAIWLLPAKAGHARSTAATLVLLAVVALIVGLVILRRGKFAAAIAAIAVPLLCSVVVFDGPYFLHRQLQPSVIEPYRDHRTDAKYLSALADARDQYRMYDEFVLSEKAGTRLGLRDFRGYVAFDSLSDSRYKAVLEFARRDPAILTDFNVKYVFHAPHFRAYHESSFVQQSLDGRAEFRRIDAVLWQATAPAPLVAFYPNVVVAPPGDATLAAMRAAQQNVATARQYAVVSHDVMAQLPAVPTVADAVGAAGSVSEIDYGTDAIAFTITANAAGLAVLNELAYPGWQVEVDGRAAKPLEANHMMRAVWLDAGRHRVVWAYLPTTYMRLAWLTKLAYALLAFVGGQALLRRWQARRANSANATT